MAGLTGLPTIGSIAGALASAPNPESGSLFELEAAFGIGASGLVASTFRVFSGADAFNATGSAVLAIRVSAGFVVQQIKTSAVSNKDHLSHCRPETETEATATVPNLLYCGTAVTGPMVTFRR